MSEYGRFILVNTRFGTSNNSVGADRYLESIRESGLARTREDFAYRKGYFEFNARLFEHFKRMLDHLCDEFPDRLVVVRPHPSESIDVWREFAAGRPALRVIREGSVHAWLLACDVAIHNGCTTGIEAMLLGTPCVAYRPDASTEYDRLLPNEVCVNAFTLGELSAFVRAVGDGAAERAPRDWQATMDRHLYSRTGKLASDYILDTLENSPITLEPRPKLLGRVEARIRILSKRTGQLVRQIAGGAKGEGPATKSHGKWSGVSEEEMRALVARFGFLHPDVRRIKLKALEKDLFSAAI